MPPPMYCNYILLTLWSSWTSHAWRWRSRWRAWTSCARRWRSWTSWWTNRTTSTRTSWCQRRRSWTSRTRTNSWTTWRRASCYCSWITRCSHCTCRRCGRNSSASRWCWYPSCRRRSHITLRSISASRTRIRSCDRTCTSWTINSTNISYTITRSG